MNKEDFKRRLAYPNYSKVKELLDDLAKEENSGDWFTAKVEFIDEKKAFRITVKYNGDKHVGDTLGLPPGHQEYDKIYLDIVLSGLLKAAGLDSLCYNIEDITSPDDSPQTQVREIGLK